MAIRQERVDFNYASIDRRPLKAYNLIDETEQHACSSKKREWEVMQTLEQENTQLSQLWMDPMFLRAYAATVSERRRWEASVQQAVRVLLGLSDNATLDAIPSASEIRDQMRVHLPYTTSLSEQIIREREGRL